MSLVIHGSALSPFTRKVTLAARENSGAQVEHETRFELAFPSRSKTSHTRRSLLARTRSLTAAPPFRWQVIRGIAQAPEIVEVHLILGPVLVGNGVR